MQYLHNPCVYGHLIFVQNISQIMEYDAIFIKYLSLLMITTLVSQFVKGQGH